MLDGLTAEIERIPCSHFFGRVTALVGPIVHVKGLSNVASIGASCEILSRNDDSIPGEIVGFKDDIALVMAYTSLEGVGPECRVNLVSEANYIYPHQSWLGRTLNGFGEPADDVESPFVLGPKAYNVKASPPKAHKRQLVGERLDLGIRAINTFMTCCKGQRMGIFAGSGVGKSVLLSQLSKFAAADVIVIGLIGERGREVREFIDNHLGPEGMQKCVVVVATSDEPALMRRQAAYMTITIAEYFRDQGAEVLCLMDSVTRFAMAIREIGLSIGEPPTSKGYTPSVFTELPQLLERAGPGEKQLAQNQSTNITGLFTVLVEGDDHNEPIADAVRGILDGHIVLERIIAERGRFPSINILRSVSRTMPDCNQDHENEMIVRARGLMSIYDDMEEMIRLGAYQQGGNPEVDEAISYHDALESFLGQKKGQQCPLEVGFEQLGAILSRQSFGVMDE